MNNTADMLCMATITIHRRTRNPFTTINRVNNLGASAGMTCGALVFMSCQDGGKACDGITMTCGTIG